MRFSRRRELALLFALPVATLSCSGSGTEPKRPVAAVEIVAGNDQTGTVGAELRSPVVVRVLDANGAPVSGQIVDFRVTSGGGSVVADTSTTNADGLAQERWRLGTVAADSQRLEARVATSGFGAVTQVFDAVGTAGPAASISKFRGDGQSAPAGTAVPIDPSVRVVDAFGNACRGARVAFTLAGGGGSIAAATSVTNDSGFATPGRWTLGPDRGLDSLTAAVGVSATTFTATAASVSPDIQVSLLVPTPEYVVGDDVTVTARVSSRYSLARVIAAGGANQVTLSYSPDRASWYGTLSLKGTARDTIQLTVTATDVNGSSTDAIVPVIHDTPPTLTIGSPLDNTVARPSVAIDVDCADDDPVGCTQLQLFANGTKVATGTSGIHTTLSLAAWDGRSVTLGFSAFDSRGQAAGATRVVQVMTNPRMTELSSATGSAWDYAAGRLLYLDTASTPIRLAIRNSTGADEVIPLDSLAVLERGFLSPFGAIFVAQRSASTSDVRLYDWRNGAFASSPAVANGSYFDVSGNFAIYVTGSSGGGFQLYRRDLQSGTDALIAGGVGGGDQSVAANGDVALWGSDHEIYWNHGGALTRLTADADSVSSNVYPLTDGTQVLYQRTISGPGNRVSLIRADGASLDTLVLDRPTVAWLTPGLDYAVNAGWAAYTQLDGSGIAQVWVRSPTGVVRQASSAGASSQIDALGDDGSVIFLSGGEHYYAATGGSVTVLGVPTSGRFVWRDGGYVLLLGRSAFKFTP